MQSKIMLAGIAVAIATASSVAYCKTAEPSIAPLSMQLTRSGETLLNGHKAQAAIDQFETALAVDPRNTRAYIGIARSYDQMGLPGRAVKFYREALAIDPNDLTALSEQGEAYMARGAVALAKDNLERIRKLCQSECQNAVTLAATIEKGPPALVTAATEKPATPKIN
ncbi:tetratricopeptide repeat protein [Sphingosinicella soli]|uniref:Tetratricopeptide (TPR) repeat protein n=1 Tax=Sphingosinicella soli TaxID=333708 RepID=A0A7W7AZQ6_9SPHN|nr:tetratricopeptide repeat protein [Sphingosinicella soli]MBB4631363.1 tetratricopeptide (TPR) repeat protein [Sphingosinicella soli]